MISHGNTSIVSRNLDEWRISQIGILVFTMTLILLLPFRMLNTLSKANNPSSPKIYRVGIKKIKEISFFWLAFEMQYADSRG